MTLYTQEEAFFFLLFSSYLLLNNCHQHSNYNAEGSAGFAD